MNPKLFEAKQKHHYVWADYMKRWGNGTNNVYYTTTKGKIAHDSVKGIACESYFYKVTHLNSDHEKFLLKFSSHSPELLRDMHRAQLNVALAYQQMDDGKPKCGAIGQFLHANQCNYLENIHADFESEILPVFEYLANEELDILDNNWSMMAFTNFLGHQLTRTKPFKDGSLAAIKRDSGNQQSDVKLYEHCWWMISLFLGFNVGSAFYNDRHSSKHVMLINDTETPFITSDFPVVNVHECISETEINQPLASDFYYPISPRIAYMINDSDRFPRGKVHIDENVARELNTKLATQAMKIIVGDSKESLEPYKKVIGKRYLRQSKPIKA